MVFNKKHKTKPAFELQEVSLSDSRISTDHRAHLVLDHGANDSAVRKVPILNNDAWLLEISSLTFAVAVLVATIILLSRYDKKPDPQWSITLNTILSFASLIFRASILVPVANCISQLCWVWCSKQPRPLYHIMLFNQASRSLFGGFHALSTGIWSTLVALGVCMMLIATVAGPFFQQSISFYPALAVDPKTLAYSSAAKSYNGMSDSGSASYALMGRSTTYNMNSAMYSGLLSSGMVKVPNAPFSCPTGNCTWDAFPTLGIGIQCIDMSKYYTLNCSSRNTNTSSGYPDACRIDGTAALNMSDGRTGTRGYFEIDSSNATRNPEVTVMHFSSYFKSWVFLLPNTWAEKPTAGVTEITWARATGLNRSSDASYTSHINKDSKLDAGMCILYTEMQEISARMDNGVYTEEVRRRQTRADNAELFDEGINLVNNGSVQPIKYTYKPKCNVDSSIASCNTTEETLSIDFFKNNYLLAGLNYAAADRQFGNLTMTYDQVTGQQITKMLYQTPNISKALENMAQYMTVALRSNDTTLALQSDPHNATGYPSDYVAPTHRVSGYAYRNEVHVHFRWPWLSLPAALVVLVAVLLVCTIRITSKHQVGIWKHNPLAVLLHTPWRPETPIQASTSADIGRSVNGLRVRVVRNRVSIGDNKYGGELSD